MLPIPVLLPSLTSQTLVSANTEKANKRAVSAVLREAVRGRSGVNMTAFQGPSDNDCPAVEVVWQPVPSPGAAEMPLPFLL